MATSFAAYASQFLNRQQHNGGTSSLSSSQPMFFSFTTDDGSRAGHSSDESDLGDLDDPHLRRSDGPARRQAEEDDDDPYLRLDEDERFEGRTTDSTNVPLISSDRGWLAHQASPLRQSRSPSPLSSPASSTSPPPDIFTQPQPPPRASREPVSLSLTQSLLPRDGLTRPLDVFSLPDPRHTPRSRRKYQDSIWTALWCTGLMVSLISSFAILFLTHKPERYPHTILPYTTLLHTVPLLTIITFLSAAAAYAHIYLLRLFVKPVMVATTVFVPATLFVSAIWAFVGSFMWDADTEPTWGETVGLRLFSLIPLVLSLLTARRILNLPYMIHTTSSTLTLTTHLLSLNPFLLALSPVILLASLLISIPFLTLIFRLLLIGYATRITGGGNGPSWEWHVRPWANWAIFFAVGVWLWSWGVARGILKMTCAGVVGAWYFADPATPPQPPTSSHTIHAALTRSTSPSLGTVCLAALLLTLIRLLALFAVFLQNLPSYIGRLAAALVSILPIPLGTPLRSFSMVLLGTGGSSILASSFLRGIAWSVGVLEGVTSALSRYALIYAGLTGDGFMPSARRARALTAGVEQRERGRMSRRKFKNEPPLALLTIAPLTLSFPFALTTYLFVAHTLGVPNQALGAAVLAGGVTALVGRFCVGLVEDTADTLYICYCIDKDTGERRREEVFTAFEYEPKAKTSGRTRQQMPPSQTATPATVQAPVRQPQPQLPREPHHEHTGSSSSSWMYTGQQKKTQLHETLVPFEIDEDNEEGDPDVEAGLGSGLRSTLRSGMDRSSVGMGGSQDNDHGNGSGPTSELKSGTGAISPPLQQRSPPPLAKFVPSTSPPAIAQVQSSPPPPQHRVGTGLSPPRHFSPSVVKSATGGMARVKGRSKPSSPSQSVSVSGPEENRIGKPEPESGPGASVAARADDDIDPFEQSHLMDEGKGRGGEGKPSEKEDEGDGDGDGSQFFPGSGFF